ncbi:MAG: SAM-dependent methyltransferase [Nannocystaceae bacterium]
MTRPTSEKLNRARRSVARHLSQGWERAVFAAPQGEDDSNAYEDQVVIGPGSGAFEASDFAALWERVISAAALGLVKLTFVLDDRRRVLVDARHGFAKLKACDDASIIKAMGGKDRLFRPDTDAPLLRAIGIMNADGTISARHAKKYKQVHHLAQLCRPAWENVAKRRPVCPAEPLRILDVACGNSYLSFVLAADLRKARVPARVVGVDQRSDVVARSHARAETMGDGSLQFFQASISAAIDTVEHALDGPVDIMLALHACDTATDDALALAISRGVTSILCVPCCQAELAKQLQHAPHAPHADVAALLEHNLLRRQYAAVLSDALRVEILSACGYEVSTTEFVDVGHTPKNLLIRAQKREIEPAVADTWHLEAVRAKCERLGLQPHLLTSLLQLAASPSTSTSPASTPTSTSTPAAHRPQA